MLIARNALNVDEVKYFLSNAPEPTATGVLLLVAFSRWKIERMFEDGKGELGLDHFEVRKYLSVRRHLILSCLSYQFLTEFHQKHREKKSRPDGLPSAFGDGPAGPALASRRPLFAEAGRVDRSVFAAYAAAELPRGALSPQTNDPAIARDRLTSGRPVDLPLATLVAL